MPHIDFSRSTCDSPKMETRRVSSARSSAAASVVSACLAAKASASAARHGRETPAMFSTTATVGMPTWHNGA